MDMIRVDRAHAVQDGRPKVDVGVIDTGIDSTHIDFIKNGVSNVDTSRGASFAGSPDVTMDNQFHGTHVAGIIAARDNGHGVIGIAPDVTLVPIKVCDASGFCYAASVARGIVHAGDQRLDVINTSLFADDAISVPPNDVDTSPNSTQFKCMSDPAQAGFRIMVERAIRYAQSRGVAHVSAIGNSDTNLRKPGEEQAGATDADCDVVPAEVDGVTAVVALGPDGLKSSYSSWGMGHADVAAPGGDAEFIEDSCVNEVTSTIPGNLWGCFQGTSMASPHVAGVAALIVSQYGTAGPNGDVRMPDGSVDRRLKATAIDIGRAGVDKCYGSGRVDALRAVRNTTSSAFRASGCDDY
jgi:subtilisin family serine protease